MRTIASGLQFPEGPVAFLVSSSSTREQVSTGDPLTTNICFGGPDLRTAYVTCSGTGQLVAFDRPQRGLQLAYG